MVLVYVHVPFKIYQDVLQENFTINGLPWNEAKKEVCGQSLFLLLGIMVTYRIFNFLIFFFIIFPPDSSSYNQKKYLNATLIPETWETMVEVAKQRKTLPLKCAKEMARICSSECSYLVRLLPLLSS
jgi:hypothetical protein